MKIRKIDKKNERNEFFADWKTPESRHDDVAITAGNFVNKIHSIFFCVLYDKSVLRSRRMGK